MSPKTKTKLVNKALAAQYTLLAYNAAEAVLSLYFGAVADSIALISFGLDSVVESLSTAIVTLRLRQPAKPPHKEAEDEMRALRLVGYSFLVLSAYVALESARKLLLHEPPEPSLGGIIIAAASIGIMPAISKYRHDIGHRIGSHSLVADSRQTLLCAYMGWR